MHAMTAWADHDQLKAANSSVSQMINEAYQKSVQENRCYIKTVAEILLLTAKQDIAQRGHQENEESSNRGNFLEILELVSKHDEVVAKKCSSRKNVTYTSPQIQNEVLEILAEMVRKEIIEEVKESGPFALIVDETKDLSKTEQIAFVLRYVHQSAVYESFLQFTPAEKLDAQSLTEKITSCLEKFGLDYKTCLVGQGYDGASVMSGKTSGVSTRIKEICPNAAYIHCYAHRLNLVLVDTCKSIPEAADFFSLLERLYVFISGSYVHNKWKQIQQEMFPKEQPMELKRLSDTRWACRSAAVHAVLKRLPVVLRVLEQISEETNADRAVDARALKGLIDFQFLVLLSSFDSILGASKSVSDMLQSPNLDLAKAMDIIETLKQTLHHLRTHDDGYESVWQDAIEIAKVCNITIPKETLTRRARREQVTPARLQNTVLLAPLTQHRGGETKQVFKVDIFNAILDKISVEIQNRFSNTILNGIQALNPRSESFLQSDAIRPYAEVFQSNISDLVHEMHQAKRMLERKAKLPQSLLELFLVIEPYKEAFFELFKLLKISLTIPVTSAAAERSFSALKVIKTYLRNSMSNVRLSNLGILHIERKRAANLNLDEFVDIFANNHNNRRINLL